MRFTLSLFGWLGLSLSAQPLSYTLLPPGGPGPSARFDGVIAHDPSSRRIFLFGGSDGAARNDLWAYSLVQRRWTEVETAGEEPPARWGHTMVFDSQRRRLIVFGGQAAVFFSDAWAYDIASGSWNRLAAQDAGPSRRYGHSAIYDAGRDRMIVSHGFTDAGRFDDTWEFKFATNTWRNVSPPSLRPLRRCLHEAVYDAENSRMLLYGGCASGAGPCPLGDLWSFDLTGHRWTELSSQIAPAPRQHYGMVFDSARRRLVLFGGVGSGILNDTWEYDPLRAWRQPLIEGPAPSPRSRHESAYASDRGTAFFFGGSTVAGLSSELWMLGPGFVSPRPEVSRAGVVNAFSGATGPLAPGEIVSIYGSGLGPVEGVAFAFDPLTGRLPASGPGVSVTFNGIAAPLYYAQSEQLNIQVPYELQGAESAELVVRVNGSASEPIQLRLAPSSPGLFPRPFHPDGSEVTLQRPASAGGIVTYFATGQGLTTPPSQTGSYPVNGFPEPAARTTLTIGGQPAEILFRGQAPGAAGVMQINARVPESSTDGELPVVLSIGESTSQPGVLIPVRR